MDTDGESMLFVCRLILVFYSRAIVVSTTNIFQTAMLYESAIVMTRWYEQRSASLIDCLARTFEIAKMWKLLMLRSEHDVTVKKIAVIQRNLKTDSVPVHVQ